MKVPQIETMEIDLQLYSILRDKLPKEAKGRVVMQLDDKATLVDLLKKLEIERRVVISVNSVLERDFTRQLRDGDEVKIFSSVSGG